MKKIVTFLFLLGFTSGLFAQQKIIFHYKFVQNIKGITGGSELELYYQNGNSLELPKINDTLKNTTTYEGANVVMRRVIRENDKKPPFVLKSPASNSLIFAQRLWIQPAILVVDTLNNFKWNIFNETKSIGGVVCTKAETNFRGRKYTAWFKKDNALQVGPWKFGGLPGIIYEVKDSEELFTYLLTGYDFVDSFPVDLQLPALYNDDIMISQKDFIAKWKDVKKDVEKDNDKITYTLIGTSNIKHEVAPIQELY
ncbi:GLPGLI family protein [Pedobacter aquatilis]|uniref:GLPGLI family protein n=1 Tax=Pedobacter aquatilis TaxID=351343 RepID=UPI002930B10A|nr:GLPGLI family protein [Pedobacter aquatilis]